MIRNTMLILGSTSNEIFRLTASRRRTCQAVALRARLRLAVKRLNSSRTASRTAILALIACFSALLGCGQQPVATVMTAPVVAPTVSPPVAPLAVAAVETAAPSEPAPKPAAPVGQRPPADRTPRRPGEAEKITFDDLNLGMAADMVYRPFLLNDRVKELDGQSVSILGYIHGGVESARGIKEFILLKNTECKFGPGGQADHLARIYLDAGQTTDFTKKPIKVEGVLKVEIFEGPDKNTWAIYRMDRAKVVR